MHAGPRSSLLLLLAACASAAAPERVRPPNIVLVLADDVGVEAFRDWGGESYATPRIDALAAGGLRFTRAHSTPLCTPSRVELLTGREGVRNYIGFSLLKPGETTLAHRLKAAGYATGAVGKWQLYGARHYGADAGRGTRPEDAGFERWCLWQVEELGSRYWGPLLEEDGVLVQHPDETYGPDRFREWALEFMRANAARPFLLYYPLALVHAPFEPTPASATRDGADRQANFGDMLEYMDGVVGSLADELEELGIAQRTLLLFVADNGTDRGIVSRANGVEVRGGKRGTTDRGTHVPLVASMPGTVPANRVCDDLIDFSDLVPTLCAAAGLAPLPDDATDGVSFWPQLRGRPGTPRRHVATWYDPRPGREGWPQQAWVRGPRYKLYDDGRYVDVLRDPGEEHPLAPEGLDREASAERARLGRHLAELLGAGEG